MKNISLKICLVIVALFGVMNAGVASQQAPKEAVSTLPDCPGKQPANSRKVGHWKWSDCIGTWWGRSDGTGHKYVGEYYRGQKSGQGTYTLGPKGDHYVGRWLSGMRNGQGTWTSDEGDQYIGLWKDNKRHGQGIYTYANGKVERGMWRFGELVIVEPILPALAVKIPNKSDLPDCSSNTGNNFWDDCFGTIAAGGSSYVGEWKDGNYSGQGTFTFSPSGANAGKKYVGEWKGGRWNGQGSLTYADGTVREGIWKDGVFQYENITAIVSEAKKSMPIVSAAKKSTAVVNKEKSISPEVTEISSICTSMGFSVGQTSHADCVLTLYKLKAANQNKSTPQKIPLASKWQKEDLECYATHKTALSNTKYTITSRVSDPEFSCSQVKKYCVSFANNAKSGFNAPTQARMSADCRVTYGNNVKCTESIGSRRQGTVGGDALAGAYYQGGAGAALLLGVLMGNSAKKVKSNAFESCLKNNQYQYTKR